MFDDREDYGVAYDAGYKAGLAALESGAAAREKELKAPGPPKDSVKALRELIGKWRQKYNGSRLNMADELEPLVTAVEAETAKLQAEIAELRAGADAAMDLLNKLKCT